MGVGFTLISGEKVKKRRSNESLEAMNQEGAEVKIWEKWVGNQICVGGGVSGRDGGEARWQPSVHEPQTRHPRLRLHHQILTGDSPNHIIPIHHELHARRRRPLHLPRVEAHPERRHGLHLSLSRNLLREHLGQRLVDGVVEDRVRDGGGC